MWFGVLGAVEVRSDDGGLISVGGPRVRSLLAMLLLDAGQEVSVRLLVEGLYGRSDSAHALQTQVSRLRRGLRAAGGELVEFGPAGYRLAVDPEDVDVHRFERLAAEGRRALAAGDHVKAAPLTRSALDLWRGPALDDVMTAPFAEPQAARLEELRIAVLEDHIEARLGLGEHHHLVAELPGIMAAHPLRERLRGQLMRALYGSGRQAEALEVYEDARRTLAGELGVDPSPELQNVHLAVLRAERTLAEVPRAGVPAQLTSFVGRGEDLGRVGELLKRGRLVTLTGPGGVGKTRLAIEAAAREPGEVRFVDLAPVSDVPQALIGALGLREAGLVPSLSGPLDAIDRLVSGLAGRRLLLILDNCEHVLDAVARLARHLLAACSGLRILVTSRERLDVTGETLCPVAPLAVPPPEAAASDGFGLPAVRLFADRAAAVRPGFAVGDANISLVLHVCRTLDGLPLAIELAGARLRSLTLDDVAVRLDDRFALLSRGDRTAAPRHQTLRSVVAWSWDLLSRDEQALAARLTVFVDGATLHAASRVCGLPDAEVVERLADLVDKSLVETADGRYRMLETVREFCAERLAGTGEGERLRAAHAAYFLDLARTAEPHLRGPDQLHWLARLDAERGNLDAALRWAVRADPLLAVQLITALSWHGQLRGLSGGRGPMAAELLKMIGPEPSAGQEEEYVLCLAHAAASSDGYDRELRLWLDRLPSAPTAAGPRYPFLAVLRLMVLGPRRDEVFGADPWSRAFARLAAGTRGLLDGDPAEAERAFRAALGGFRAVGDRWGIATALDNLAWLSGLQGDEAAFVPLMAEALDLAGQLGAVEDVTRMLVRNADALATAGRPTAARQDYERAAELARGTGLPEAQADAQRGLADLARLDGDLARARELYGLAMDGCERESMSTRWTRWQVLIGLSRIAQSENDARLAQSYCHLALIAALVHGNLPAATIAAEGMAAAFLGPPQA
ncbi:BTAD domain-containing putative transcriptional regulator [Nonomuraea sp. NPDC049269]|uniref:BTAD domain-containing putative transcriptional regulator n=1 Tax=Nonomuraea sp. NPDC049269 TaxID=3364349 RepID=UPI0037210EAD